MKNAEGATIEEIFNDEEVNTNETKSPEAPTQETKAGTKRIRKIIDLTEDGGVVKRVLRKSSLEQIPFGCPCELTIHYTLCLSDGSKFFSTHDTNEPLKYKLGSCASAGIRGFDIAVASMRLAELAEFIISPDYAFGYKGQPPKIPPNETLTLELELLKIDPEDMTGNKGGIKRHVISKISETNETPFDGGVVTVSLRGTCNGRLFDEREGFTFHLGIVPDDVVIAGVQKALSRFTKGEICRLIIQPQFAFGRLGSEKYAIPPMAEVIYVVTLHEFEVLPETYLTDDDDSWSYANDFKERGNGFFKLGKYENAIDMFSKAHSYMYAFYTKEGVVQDGEPTKLKTTIYSNMALCYMKLKNFSKAQDACDTALACDPNNVKALYRRGLCLLEADDSDKALDEFLKIQEIDPKNKAAEEQINKLIEDEKMKFKMETKKTDNKEKKERKERREKEQAIPKKYQPNPEDDTDTDEEIEYDPLGFKVTY